jgi:hypothetical protein
VFSGAAFVPTFTGSGATISIAVVRAAVAGARGAAPALPAAAVAAAGVAGAAAGVAAVAGSTAAISIAVVGAAITSDALAPSVCKRGVTGWTLPRARPLHEVDISHYLAIGPISIQTEKWQASVDWVR